MNLNTVIAIGILAALLLLGTIPAACTYSNYVDDKAIVDITKNGADPVSAACAINMNKTSGNGMSTAEVSVCLSHAK